ncbi:glycosyltransferase family 4 protein [Bombella sp. TMW 2.2543]|uniref:Glycosyltransferase family 4 protein n=1 Tax=Bombella pluederhausensis TaxID=2967336 RepID=A0ABT3WEW3_9PROT|nr:glycosyltransferase family 1 protein [Bombella pluederhausensis]MCX5617632.1 glycosyltransferase family 4 protein [Bombella pluederhausensis]
MSQYKVVIDGFNLAMPKGTGVATYARTLSKVLSNANCNVSVLYGLDVANNLNSSLKEVLFFEELTLSSPYRRDPFPSIKWWKRTYSHFRGREANEIFIKEKVDYHLFQERMPAFDHIFNVPFLFQMASGFFKKTGRFLEIKLSNAPDIAHWTYPLPIRIVGAKNIYTIHDIVPLKMPSTTLDDKKFYYSLLKKIVKSSDFICTISNTSLNDITSFFPDARNKIYNTYQVSSFNAGINEYSSGIREVERLFGLKNESFFLFFGQLEPKKNIGRLIESFISSNSKHPLVLVGSNGWKEEDELRFLQRGIDLGVIFHIPYLPAHHLALLIRHARAVLFPSISEGFGLPILEAFNLGTPVLTANIGATKEIAGDAAVLVDPYSREDIKKGIELLGADDDLCDSLRTKGYERAFFFSEDNYRDRLMELYRMVL